MAKKKRSVSDNIRLFIENWSPIGCFHYWQTQKGYCYMQIKLNGGEVHPVKRISSESFLSTLEEHYDY